MIHIGIDPGKLGGLALVWYDGSRPILVAAVDMPLSETSPLDVGKLLEICTGFAVPSKYVKVLIEEQSVWRGKNIRNVGTEKILNQQAGMLWGALIGHGYECHWVPIWHWKRLAALGPPRYKLNKGVYKKLLLERLYQLFEVNAGVELHTPRGKILDGRCTAAMIARKENLE